MNTLKLKDIKDSDMIPPDDWNYHQWQILNDLGFQLDGSFRMSFEHEENFDGKEKSIKLSVYKKKDGWYLEFKKQNNENIVAGPSKFYDLTDIIHDIFQKF